MYGLDILENPAPLTYVELWDTATANNSYAEQAIMGNAAAPYGITFANPFGRDAIPSPIQYWPGYPFQIAWPWSSINNNDEIISTANDMQSNYLVTKTIGSGSLYVELDAELPRPQMADDSKFVMRLGTDTIAIFPPAFFPYETPASPNNGFSAVGQSPGSSDDGTAVAWAGVRDGQPGIFVAVRDANGTLSAPIPVAGVSGNGIFDPGETGDWNRNYTIEPENEEADLGPFTDFVMDSRVGINRSFCAPNIDGNYSLAFLAKDLSSTLSLWQADIDLADYLSDPDHPASKIKVSHKLIARLGDQIQDVGGEITDLSIHDPMNNSGQIAFWAQLGSGIQVIVATPKPQICLSYASASSMTSANVAGDSASISSSSIDRLFSIDDGLQTEIKVLQSVETDYMIAEKGTIIRAFVKTNTGAPVSLGLKARLTIYKDGTKTTINEIPTWQYGIPVDTKLDGRDMNLAKSFNFVSRRGFTDGKYQFTVEIFDNDDKLNGQASSKVYNFLQPVWRPQISIIPVFAKDAVWHYTAPRIVETSTKVTSLLDSMFPFTKSIALIKPPTWFDAPIDIASPWYSVWALYIAAEYERPTIFLLPNQSLLSRVEGRKISDGIASITDDMTLEPNDKNVQMHEIGHTLGMLHSFCPKSRLWGWGPYNPTCPAEDVWPNPNPIKVFESKGKSDPFSIYINPYKDTPPVPMTGPARRWLMDYGDDPSWIAPHEYEGLINHYYQLNNKPMGLRAASPDGRFTIIGMITNSDAVTVLYSAHKVEQQLATTNFDSGGYVLRILDNAGAELTAQDFDLDFYGEGETEPVELDTASFFLTIDWPANGHTIEFLHDGVPIHAFAITEAPPTVTLQSPNGGETMTGRQTVTWTRSDQDSTDLVANLLYSSDGGITFTPAAVGIKGTSAVVDFSLLPGSTDSILKVEVSDGFNLASDTSDAPFNVPKKSPEAYIAEEMDGASYVINKPIEFEGGGYDLEDGLLTGAAVTWTSDRDGVLGQGEDLALDTLSSGFHTITVEVTDSDGNTAQAQAVITVLQDSDNDGLPDTYEQSHGLNPSVNDALADPDQDDLDNGEEFHYGTDPHNPDTDGDGILDGTEVANFSDPLTSGDGNAPTATTEAVSVITSNGAWLNGVVDPQGATTTVSFEYGPTTGYGSSVSATPDTLSASDGTTAVTAALSGLTCNTLYHNRVKALNSTGTSYGDDVSFTTSACPSFSLTVTKAGTGSGTVRGSGIDCGTDCTENYAKDSSVTLTATPSTPGSIFSGWTGACTGTGDCVLSMNAAKQVTATFTALPTYPLTVSLSGQGTVTSNPAGINCGTDCKESYVSGTQITLTPSAAVGYVFSNWSGACSGAGSCSVTMNAAKQVTATFKALPKYTLTVKRKGQGTVTSNPAGINCGTDCKESYVTGTLVTLTPSAAAGYVFSNWTGACSGAGSCSVTMNAAKQVTATFKALPKYTLTVKRVGQGTVTSNPAGIKCGSDCKESYVTDTLVTLTPSAAAGYVFSNWSGACSGTGSCAVTMNAAKQITATFAH